MEKLIAPIENFRNQHIVTWTVGQRQVAGQAKTLDPVKLFQDYQKQALQKVIQQTLPEYLRMEVPKQTMTFEGPVAYGKYYTYEAGLYVFTRPALFYGILIVALLYIISVLFGKGTKKEEAQ
jgi:hypothetical protein